MSEHLPSLWEKVESVEADHLARLREVCEDLRQGEVAIAGPLLFPEGFLNLDHLPQLQQTLGARFVVTFDHTKREFRVSRRAS